MSGAAGRPGRAQRRWLYEHRHEPLIGHQAFLLRLARHGGVAALILVFAFGAGALGYRATEGMPWLDAFLNAAMILSGMGPVDTLATDAGKLFATLYALFSGVVFVAASSVLLVPVLHRVLHRFHLEQGSEGDGT